MKRDWDVIREVLIEIEALDTHTRDNAEYSIRRGQPSEADMKAEQALLLYKAAFITGIDASTFDGPALMAPELTWAGHELLETMRSTPVWERIKKMAADKGIELSFEAVKVLATRALTAVIGE
jgi:hypothetical protein